MNTVQVRLTVPPARIETLDPLDALVLVVVSNAAAACCDVRGASCQHVFYFAGADAGAVWRAAHPEATLLSVEDAYAVAHLLARTRLITFGASWRASPMSLMR